MKASINPSAQAYPSSDKLLVFKAAAKDPSIVFAILGISFENYSGLKPVFIF